MPEEAWKFFASLGVGGVLAGVVFYFYHLAMTSQVKAAEERTKQEQERGAREKAEADRRLTMEQNRTDLMLAVVKENTVSNTAVVKSVEANTAMVERLCHTREFMDWNDNQGRRQGPRQQQQGG